MIKYNCEQRSEAWHSLRLGRITGTSFADLVAKKETLAYKNLISRLAGEIITGKEADEENYTNEAMQRGIDLEPEARKFYEQTFDIEVEQVGFVTPDEDNEFADVIGFSPDGLIEKGFIEIKCPNRNTHLRYIRNENMPTEYKWQVQGGLFVSGGLFCDFVSFYPQMKLFCVRVYPDMEMQKQIETEIRIAIPKIKDEIDFYNKYDFLND